MINCKTSNLIPMDHIVNVAFQILPKSKDKDIYSLVDVVIEEIEKSGLKYKVCPFETVIEGRYNEIMDLVYKAQQSCLKAGAEGFMSYLKIQVDKSKDVSIEDKTGKYEIKNPIG